MSKLVHPELSYQVRGVLLDVYNTLGPMLKEEYYRDAVVLGLDKRQIACQPEKAFEVYYEDQRVGLYYVDVWIAGGKLLLELKVAHPGKKTLDQALDEGARQIAKKEYGTELRAAGAEPIHALVVAFDGKDVRVRRLESGGA